MDALRSLLGMKAFDACSAVINFSKVHLIVTGLPSVMDQGLLAYGRQRKLKSCVRREIGGLSRPFYCAFIQLSDPATLTDRSEKKIRAGAPSAVPR
jgi:hypothetical protein